MPEELLDEELVDEQIPQAQEQPRDWNPPTWAAVGAQFREAFPDIHPGELQRRYEGARELGIWRHRLQNAEETNVAAFFRSTNPFGIVSGIHDRRFTQASERFAQGDQEPGDAQWIAAYERLQELDQNRGVGSSIGRTVLGAGTYGLEFMAGGALMRGASGLVRGGSALANPSAASAIGGMIGRAGVQAAPRVWSETEARRVPEIERDETGRAVGLPDQEVSRTFWNAMPAGAFDAFTEAFTEQLGGTRAFQAVGRAPGWILDRVGLGRARNLISAGVANRLAQAGIHGPLSEMGEERAGELMRGFVLGNLMGERDTYGATGQLAGAGRSLVQGDTAAAARQSGQALRQLFIEGAAFSLIQGGSHGLGHIMGARSGPEATLRAEIEAEVERQRAAAQSGAQPAQPGATEASTQQPETEPVSPQVQAQTQQTGVDNQPGQVDPEVSAAIDQINRQLDESEAPTAPGQPEPPAQPARPIPTQEQRAESMWDGGTGNFRREMLGQDLQGIARTRFSDLTPEQRRVVMGRMGMAAPAQPQAVPEPPAPRPAPPAAPQAQTPVQEAQNAPAAEPARPLPSLIELQDIAAAMGVKGWRGLGQKALIDKLGGKAFLDALEASKAAVEPPTGKPPPMPYKDNPTPPAPSPVPIHPVSTPTQRPAWLRPPVAPGVAAEVARAKKGIAAARRGGLRVKESAKAVAEAAKEVKIGVREFKEPAPTETRASLTPKEEIGLAWYRTGEEGGLREVAEANKVSHETVRNWAKSALKKLGLEYKNVKEQEAIGQASRLSEAQAALTAAERGEETWEDDDKAPIPPVVAESGMSPEELVELTKAKVRKYSDYAEKQEALQNEMLKEIANAKKRGQQVPKKKIDAYLARLAEIESSAVSGSEAENQEPGEVSEENGEFGSPVTEAEQSAALEGAPPGRDITASAAAPAGQAKVERLPRPQALANVYTEEARQFYKLTPIEQAARLEDAGVWDEAMDKLRADPQAGVRLVEELNNKPRATTVQENALLAHRRVSLANEHERATFALIAELRKQGRTDIAKVNELEVRERWLLNEIDQTDQAIKKAGTEWGRSGRWRRMLVDQDFTLAGMLMRAAVAKGKSVTQLTPQEQAEIKELYRKNKELQAQLDQAIKEGRTKPGQASKWDFEVEKARAAFERKLRLEREARDPLKVRMARHAGEAVSTTKSLMAMIDLPLGRQGWIGLVTHPGRTMKGMPEAFKALVSEEAAERALYDIYKDPMYPMFLAAGGEITDAHGPLSRHEEGIFSKWLGKIPILGQVGRASNRIHQTMMNRMRFDAFKDLVRNLARPTAVDRFAAKIGGWPAEGEITNDELVVAGNYANVMTGRGHMTKMGENALPLLNAVFFAPKHAISRFEMVLGQPLWTFKAGLAPRARWLVAKEYARLLTAAGIAIGMAVAAGWDWEKDPRSSQFGKLRLGSTRVDLTGGLASAGTFLSRITSGTFKRPDGSTRPVEARDIGGFVRQKMAPVPGALISLRTGRDAIGRPITPAKVGLSTATPLFAWDVYEALKAEGFEKGTALSLMALGGLSINTYDRR